MDSKIAEQILDELAPTFEAIESRSDAILHFLKDKGIADDEQLAPYLEQAAAASNVRWRALRVRMGRLFAMAEKSDEERTAKETAKQVREEKTKVDQQVQASAKTLEESAENHTGDADSETDSKQHDQKQQKQMERGEKPEVKEKGEPSTAATETQQEKPPRNPTAGDDAKASSPKSGSTEETSSQKPASESSDKNAA